jgi:hypothetical protein
MNIFEELGFTGREAELLHDNAELRITVEQQAAEIERLKAELGSARSRLARRMVLNPAYCDDKGEIISGNKKPSEEG